MRTFSRSRWLSLLALLPLAVLARAGAPAADAKVEVQVVKYPQLADLIKQHKGQVVVVDFWGTY
jgi:hypothetical protein